MCHVFQGFLDQPRVLTRLALRLSCIFRHPTLKHKNELRRWNTSPMGHLSGRSLIPCIHTGLISDARSKCGDSGQVQSGYISDAEEEIIQTQKKNVWICFLTRLNCIKCSRLDPSDRKSMVYKAQYALIFHVLSSLWNIIMTLINLVIKQKGRFDFKHEEIRCVIAWFCIPCLKRSLQKLPCM